MNAALCITAKLAADGRDGFKLGHSAMPAQCPHCPKADIDPRIAMSQKCH
jgi:hypothetical protein